MLIQEDLPRTPLNWDHMMVRIYTFVQLVSWELDRTDHLPAACERISSQIVTHYFPMWNFWKSFVLKYNHLLSPSDQKKPVQAASQFLARTNFLLEACAFRSLFFLLVSSFLSLVPHVYIFLRQSLHGEVLKNELDKWGH